MILPGTAISVRLLQPLNSASAQPGQSFAGYVISSEAVKGSSPVRPGTLVEGTCLAVRRAAGDSRPGYIRLALQGLRDAEGRFAPLEATTFSQWGMTALGGRSSGDAARRPHLALGVKTSDRSGSHAEGKASSNSLLASMDALLPTEEDIKFVVLKPSFIPPAFCLP
jgi:hypothetical protein